MFAMRTSILLSLLCLGSLGTATCGSACNQPVNQAGTRIDCNGIERVGLDCTSEVSYQGVSAKGSVNVMDIAGAEGSYEEKAIRRVSDQIGEYVTMQTRACRDYNACILDPEQYRSEADDIRKRIMLLPTLTEALKTAKSETERTRILDQLYRGIVPDEKRVEEITFELGITAEVKTQLGEGSYSVVPGGMVPTGAKLAFGVNVSKDAHVYMFQTTPTGEISVLFPDPRIGTENPLRAGSPVRIPPSPQQFRVNAKDVGTENVYVVVSHKPVDNLDAALAKVKGGQVSTLKEDRVLQNVASVQPSRGVELAQCKNQRKRQIELDPGSGAEQPSCTRARGVELDPGAGTGEASKSRGTAVGSPGMAVRTSPGDDLIVQVFPFRHVTAEEFEQAGGLKTVRTRGVVVEE
jgi:hypothetical protein